MREISFRQLRAVAAIARAGRMRAAADALGITPPAVTQQLAQLEAKLGLPLFERGRQGLRPTEAGALVVKAAGRVQATLDGTRSELALLAGLGAGSVRVGVTSTAKYFAPAAIAGFVAANPAIAVELVVGNRAAMVGALMAAEIDLAVMGAPPEALDLESVAFGEHPFVVIAAAGHRLATLGPVADTELADEPFLVRERDSGTRRLMERVFAAAGVEPRRGMELDSNETIKQAVMAGLGIAFLSAHTVAAEIEAGRLALLDIAWLPERREWRVARRRDARAMPAPAALWEFFVARGASYLPELSARGR